MDDSSTKNEAFVPMSSNSVQPREFMINTAVHFLQNPRVQKSPLSQKRAFLIKKGLTNDEIDLAIERANIPIENQKSQEHPYVPNQIVSAHPQLPLYRPTIWSKLNRISTTAVVLGVAFYGIYRFYKLYIEPWLFGTKTHEDRLAEMEKQLVEVSRSLSQLRMSVSSIEDAVQKQTDHQTTCKTVQAFDSTSYLLDLKTDISTVKSLLLNRHQFPDVPKLSPSIPSWQMISQSEIKEGEANNNDTKECGDKSNQGNKSPDGQSDSSSGEIVLEKDLSYMTNENAAITTSATNWTTIEQKSSSEETIETLTMEEALTVSPTDHQLHEK